VSGFNGCATRGLQWVDYEAWLATYQLDASARAASDGGNY
jgi:hypothetical protein